jgi:hypothetical protein|tara:strand:+ start:455 stop:625 length:171 start_codon:yes stop_codon:yes gene_type:complete
VVEEAVEDMLMVVVIQVDMVVEEMQIQHPPLLEMEQMVQLMQVEVQEVLVWQVDQV